MKTVSHLILPLTDSAIRDVRNTEQFGAKACNLGRLHHLGFCTLPGFVLPNELLYRHIDFSGARQLADQISDNRIVNTLETAQEYAEKLRSAIMRTSLSVDLAQHLSELFTKHFQGKRLAVRSSAFGEDSASHSFAGQLDSFLNVSSAHELEAAITRTWASLWSIRCISYQWHKGVTLTKMGVIIQEQADAQYSGVLFTRNPNPDNDRNSMLLEYCEGLGEALVQGECEPARVFIDRANIHSLQSASVIDGAHSISPQRVREIKRLCTIALKLESEFARPLDIEWTVTKNDELQLLQVRPITIVTPPPPQVCWSNANIAENYPDAISPFLYSIATQSYSAYFRNLGRSFGISEVRIRSVHNTLERIVGVHAGKLYYNLSNIHTILRCAPGGKTLARFFNTFTGATEFPSATEADAHLSWPLRLLEAVTIPLKTCWQYLRVSNRLGEFEREVDIYCNSTSPVNLKSKSLYDLRKSLNSFLHIRLSRWNAAALSDCAAMVSYGLLERITRDSTLHCSDLLKGLSNLASNDPVLKLWDLSRRVRHLPRCRTLFQEATPAQICSRLSDPEWSELRSELFEYIETWGFRGSKELMLTVPTAYENPEHTVALLKSYVLSEGPSPYDAINKQTHDRLQGNVTLLRKAPFHRSIMIKQILKATQAAILLRERARFRQARLYVHLRYVILAIDQKLRQCGILGEADSVLFLTYRELDEYLSGQCMFPRAIAETVKLRRTQHDQFAKIQLPDSFALEAGEYLDTSAEHRFAAPNELRVDETGSKVTQQLHGDSACAGKATGRAIVLDNATEGHRIAHGDILVTRQTDPGWAPVFFMVSGLVIERGGMLSHGAIIAREYGIPAVIGVRDATRHITSGQIVSVNGGAGNVEIQS